MLVLNANRPNIVIVYKPAALLQPVNNHDCMHLDEQLFYTCLVLLSYTPYHVKSKSVNQLVRTSHLAAINLQTTHAQEALHQAREKRNTSAYALISPIKQRSDHPHLFLRMREGDLLLKKKSLAMNLIMCGVNDTLQSLRPLWLICFMK